MCYAIGGRMERAGVGGIGNESRHLHPTCVLIATVSDLQMCYLYNQNKQTLLKVSFEEKTIFVSQRPFLELCAKSLGSV